MPKKKSQIDSEITSEATSSDFKFEDFLEEDFLDSLFHEKLINSRSKGIDKRNAESFRIVRIREYEIIKKKILDGSYQFTPYLQVLKLKGRDKAPRVISIPSIRDKVVLAMIKEALHTFCPENVNRKLPNAYIRDIKKYFKTANGQVQFLQLDVEKFYDRLRHDLLEKKLKEKSIPSLLIDLIMKSVRTPTVPVNTKKVNYIQFAPEVGIPQGLSISNVLAQIYVESLDKIIDRRQYFYRRYVDDIIILNQGDISKYRYSNIVKVLEGLGLTINSEKKEEGSLREGFTFLSYKIGDGIISISDKNIEIFIRRIASKFTWYKNGMKNHSLRPLWLVDDDSRFRDVFVEELNEAITGSISKQKNYGWMFYFSEMNDISLLFKIDKIIAGFFNGLDGFDSQQSVKIKKLVRTYFTITKGKNKNYINNYDELVTPNQRRNFLIHRGQINPNQSYNDKRINELFERYEKRQIKKIERDIGYKYFKT